MTDRKLLRSLAESLRRALSGGMNDREAWEWCFRLAAARSRGVRCRARRPIPTARAQRAISAATEVLWNKANAAQIDAALADAESLGWLHQYWVNADKSKVAAKLGRKQGHTIRGADLIAATSVYSSREQVRFLLQNSLGRLWIAMHPRSDLREQWEYFIESGCVAPPRSVRELTVYDPACGCGHFLVEAVRMLFAMYREEDPHLQPASICREILVRNIFGLDIDARAIQIARGAISRICKELCHESLQPGNVVHVEGLGALAVPRGRSRAAQLLGRKYSVVATNPPYVGFRKLSPSIKRAITLREPLAASDMAAAFLSRGCAVLEPGGMLAVVTPAAWLTSAPALPLRRFLLEIGGPRVVASLGQRVFETAPLLFVSLAVMERGRPDGEVAMVTAVGDSDLRGAVKRVKPVPLERVRSDPDHAFAPSAAVLPVATATRTARTGDFVTFADGLWTGDNARDTRPWIAVERDDPEWMPVSAGHGCRRWYGPVTRVVRASAGNAWPHLHPRVGCLEYSRVAGGRLAARMVQARTAALAGVVSMFPREGVPDRRVDVLAVFNSRVGTLWLRALTSGLNFNSGYAARVPIPAEPLPRGVADLVNEAVSLTQEAAVGQIGCEDFERELNADRMSEIQARVGDIESELDTIIAAAMGVRMCDLDDVRSLRTVTRTRGKRAVFAEV